MQEIVGSLEKDRILYNVLDDSTIEIGGKDYQIIKEHDGLIIDSKFRFICDKSQENAIFNFGGNLYYCEFDNFQLNELRYIGENDYLMDDYAFLGVHGGMEILSGSREYSDWVKKANFLGIKNLAICEKDTLAGVMKFQIECNNKGIKPIIGMQVTVLDEDEEIHLLNLYTVNDDGWKNLLSINKIINVDNIGKPIKNSQLEDCMLGLVAIYNVDSISYKQYKKYDRHSKNFAISYLKYSNEDLFLHYDEKTKDIPHLVLYSIENTNKLSDLCNFNVSQNGRNLPRYKMNQNEIDEFGIDGSEDLFWSLVQKGIANKVPTDKQEEYMDRVATEWEVIEYGDVMDYFLILWDIIKWARSKGILVGDGRGSAAGSLVSYLMDITRVDPIEYNLLFERFLNRGRVEKSLPDIDVDFSGKRRWEVKEYVMNKYGYDYFCSVGTYTNLKPKSLIKEIGKLNGLEHSDINYFTTLMGDSNEFLDIFTEAQKRPQIKKFVCNNVGIINETRLMNLQPKAESIHACATIIVPNSKEIYEWIPVKVMNQNGEHVLVSQWEGAELESAGFLKEDILGLGLLDKYEMILYLIKRDYNIDIDLYSIDIHEPEIYESR
jgi:DNA polymerase-3 subunit alpha